MYEKENSHFRDVLLYCRNVKKGIMEKGSIEFNFLYISRDTYHLENVLKVSIMTRTLLNSIVPTSLLSPQRKKLYSKSLKTRFTYIIRYAQKYIWRQYNYIVILKFIENK